MKVIILCGGMGMRLREETEYKPKPMVEIGGKPILWHIMKHYAHFGYKEFILALGYRGDYIRNYFLNYFYFNSDFSIDLGSHGEVEVLSNSKRDDWKITFVETGGDTMTGMRVKMAGKYITEDRFMLTYGDAVSDVNIQNLVKFSEKQNTLGTVTGVFPPSRFGDLEIEDDKVKQFKQQLIDVNSQKPINGGYFVFKKEFLDFIPNDNSIDLEKDPLELIVSNNELSVFRHEGFWQCMDTYRDYAKLNDLWKIKPTWKIWD
jgi:glucose-1-phosphate cytidylyltransferase